MTYTDILAKLISFDTTTANNTLEAVTWVEQYLKTNGMSVHLVYNPSQTRASLVASYKGNSTDKNIIFSGHLDVVPANYEAWDTNPFVLTPKDGLLFGRGTADMKGGIAVMLSLVPTLIERQKNFAIILTHDEEVTGDGIIEVLADKTAQNLIKDAQGCIVMEPTLSNIILGHKTATTVSLEVKGKPAHSSNPKLSVNALHHAVEIYKIFYEMANQLEKQQDNDFDIPYSVADILILKGGNAINVMPDTAQLTYTCRFMSEKSEQLFLSELEKRICDYANKIQGLSVRFYDKFHLPALETDEQSDFVQKALTCFRFSPNKKVSFGTEAGYFSSLGIPTIVCGPGDIAQAHQNNEFVAPEQLSGFYEKLSQLLA